MATFCWTVERCVPIFDIKPYLPQGDCHPEASGGFTDWLEERLLQVEFPEELLKQIPEKSREALLAVLAHDARPGYQRNEERIYGLPFAGFDVKFRIRGRLPASSGTGKMGAGSEKACGMRE